MTGKKFTLRTAVAVSASCVLFAGPPVGLASAAPGDNGHHHCGGNSGQGQGNQCDDDQTPPDNGGDDQVPPPGNDQTPPGDNSGGDDVPPPGGQDDNPPPGDDQVPPNNGGDDQVPPPGNDQTPPGDNSGGDDVPPPGGQDDNPPPGDDQVPPPGNDQTPPGDNSGGDDHGNPPGNPGGNPHGNPGGGNDHQNPKPGGGDHQGPKPGGDGHDSHPPKDEHHDVINVGVDIDLTVVIAPSVTIHFGDVTVNNYTIYQVNNITTNNIVVNDWQYTEVTAYSVDTDVYYLGYYDSNGEFHCTGYYHDNVKTPEQANLALANDDVVKEVPDVEVVSGVNPVAVTSSWNDNLEWQLPLGIAVVAVAGYGLVTLIRRRNNGDGGPTDIPGAGA